MRHLREGVVQDSAGSGFVLLCDDLATIGGRAILQQARPQLHHSRLPSDTALIRNYWPQISTDLHTAVVQGRAQAKSVTWVSLENAQPPSPATAVGLVVDGFSDPAGWGRWARVLHGAAA